MCVGETPTNWRVGDGEEGDGDDGDDGDLLRSGRTCTRNSGDGERDSRPLSAVPMKLPFGANSSGGSKYVAGGVRTRGGCCCCCENNAAAPDALAVDVAAVTVLVTLLRRLGLRTDDATEPDATRFVGDGREAIKLSS